MQYFYLDRDLLCPDPIEDCVNCTFGAYSSYNPTGATDPRVKSTMSNTFLYYDAALVPIFKFNIDMGVAIAPDTVVIVNQTNVSGYQDAGVKDVIMYGSNSQTAYDNTDYADLTDLTELVSFQVPKQEGIAEAESIFALPGVTPYRYYILRINGNWGSTSYVGIRHISFRKLRDTPNTLTIPDEVELGLPPYTLKSGNLLPRIDRNMIAGVVKVNGVPAKKKIVAFEKRYYEAIASTFSNPDTGEWRIAGIEDFSAEKLTVLAFDEAGQFNAEVFDHVTPVAPVETTYRDWNPADLPNLFAWHDLVDLANLTIDQGIAESTDKSGNLHHLTQTEVARRPEYTGEGGRWTINTQCLNLDIGGDADGVLNVFVVLTDTPDGEFMLLNGQSASYYMLGATDLNIPLSSMAGAQDDVGIDGQTNNILTSDMFTTAIEAYSKFIVSSIGGNTELWTSLKIGNYTDTLDNAFGFAGTIAEIVFVKDVMSTEDIDNLLGFLHAKHGLQYRLPLTHPYKYKVPVVIEVV